MSAGLQETPSGNRLTIGFFGRTNSGKSSLINALTGQAVSLVTAVSGTTTDPVEKATEFYPLGACRLIDTAGFGDETELGALRQARTLAAMDKTDLAVLVFAPPEPIGAAEQALYAELTKRNIPTVFVMNQCDLEPSVEMTAAAAKLTGEDPIAVSAKTGSGLGALREALVKKAPADFENQSLVGHLVQKNDRVLLVMPQDIQAPKGRLILPQVQVLRDLLDHGAIATCVTPESLSAALEGASPDLIITDSQVFPLVYAQKPADSRLTSFSVLMARYKGDIEAYRAGAKAVWSLQPGDRVLIAEACSHKPLDGDIGRVKIPALLRKKVNPDLVIQVVGGQDFPADLTPYSLVIHCGGCMFGRRQVLSRVMRAVEQNVPITNYGIFLAEMAGILDKVEM